MTMWLSFVQWEVDRDWPSNSGIFTEFIWILLSRYEYLPSLFSYVCSGLEWKWRLYLDQASQYQEMRSIRIETIDTEKIKTISGTLVTYKKAPPRDTTNSFKILYCNESTPICSDILFRFYLQPNTTLTEASILVSMPRHAERL